MKIKLTVLAVNASLAFNAMARSVHEADVNFQLLTYATAQLENYPLEPGRTNSYPEPGRKTGVAAAKRAARKGKRCNNSRRT